MGAPQFTKGPWSTKCEPRSYPECDDADYPYVVRDAQGREIVSLEERYDKNLSETHGYDANLIAAAPELYEALEDARLFVDLVRLHFPTWHDDHDQGVEATDALAKIDAALAKARGEQVSA